MDKEEFCEFIVTFSLLLHLPPPSMEHIKEILEEIDANKDGRINFEEFKPLIFKLLYREGFLHINHEDIGKLKSYKWEPYCKELDHITQ